MKGLKIVRVCAKSLSGAHLHTNIHLYALERWIKIDLSDFSLFVWMLKWNFMEAYRKVIGTWIKYEHFLRD